MLIHLNVLFYKFILTKKCITSKISTLRSKLLIFYLILKTINGKEFYNPQNL